MYGFHQAQSLSNMAIGIFTLRQQLRGLLSKNWTGTIKTPYVEYLVVGGGGGGGASSSANGGGGGGAGGTLTGILPVVTGATNNITVGGGGAGGTSSVAGTAGQNSVLNSLIAVGGGGGGRGDSTGVASTGGSGGGAGYVAVGPGAQGVFGQGNAGGAALSAYGGGGGGGAGTVGLDGTSGGSSNGGNGGAGISSAISGTVTPYGGGGGGGSYLNTAGTGGVGGGGLGKNQAGGTGGAGSANTGGGGGGTGSTVGGAGGSGIVIVSYPDIYAPLTTGGATSPTVSTSGSGSIYFDGSSYFSYNAQTPFAFSTGDWTIEFWINATSFGGGPILYDHRPASTNGFYPTIYCLGTGRILFFTNSADAITGNVLSTSTWNHIAVCKISNVTKMYINGSQAGSNYPDTNTYIVGSGRPTIGGNGSSPGSSGTFYMSNIRVVKGVGVYTGAFTPPTAPLTATQSAGPSGSNIAAITSTATSLLLNSNSGSFLADSSTNSYAVTSVTGTPSWNQSSPFATGLGYKNRVYTWAPTVSAGSTATGTFTV